MARPTAANRISAVLLIAAIAVAVSLLTRAWRLSWPGQAWRVGALVVAWILVAPRVALALHSAGTRA